MDWKDSIVTFRASHGLEVQAHLVRTTRLAVVFEIASPEAVVRISEAIEEFRIAVRDRMVYSGRAVVSNLIQTGSSAICEATLTDNAWTDLVLNPEDLRNGALATQFNSFLGEWQKLYRISPEYKVVVADMHTFFSDLRIWLDQVQMNLRGQHGGNAIALEDEIATKLAKPVLPCIDALFEKFERVAEALPKDQLPAHRNYMRRQLHSLVMCSPFAHRTFVKPLGYAGDYEMVSMIARNRPEGESLYAKVVNTWFVRQPPAEAHRNRLRYLVDKLTGETLRAMRAGGKARVLNLACGPAHEVQEFIMAQPVAEQAEFLMVDFNEETLRYLQVAMDQSRHQSGRRTKVVYTKKSVYHLLKEAARGPGRETHKTGVANGSVVGAEQYDYVYCAGLFDYLTDQVCTQLVGLMYRWLAPGGLLVVTNVETRNPLRHGMEHLLDWHLIYRNAAQMLKLKPEQVSPDDVRVLTDETGVNVFMEIRRPT